MNTSERVPLIPTKPTIDTLNERFVKPKSSFMGKFGKDKNTIVSLLAVLVLFVGLVAGVWLAQRPQDTRSDASVDMVDFTLLGGGNYQSGETVNVAVSINPNNKEVSALEMHIVYDSAVFELVNGTSPITFNHTNNAFLSSNFRVLPNCIGYTQSGECPSVSTMSNYQTGTLRKASLYIGINCTSDTSCGLPITSSVQVAQLQLRVKNGAPSGNSVVSLLRPNIATNPIDLTQQATWAAALGFDGHINGDFTDATVTVEGGTTPTNTPVPSACGGADISADGVNFGQDGRVSAADYNYLISKWTGFNTCPSNDCGGADISADGVNFGQDGRVSAADYNYLISKWTGFNTCQ